MKIIIAGGRDFIDFPLLNDSMYVFLETLSLEEGVTLDEIEVISGVAKGADSLGAKWAEINGRPLHKFPAQWDTYGRSAGYIRNTQMAKAADALIAFWDGESRGTQHMIETMEELDKPVFIVYY